VYDATDGVAELMVTFTCEVTYEDVVYIMDDDITVIVGGCCSSVVVTSSDVYMVGVESGEAGTGTGTVSVWSAGDAG